MSTRATIASERMADLLGYLRAAHTNERLYAELLEAWSELVSADIEHTNSLRAQLAAAAEDRARLRADNLLLRATLEQDQRELAAVQGELAELKNWTEGDDLKSMLRTEAESIETIKKLDAELAAAREALREIHEIASEGCMSEEPTWQEFSRALEAIRILAKGGTGD